MNTIYLLMAQYDKAFITLDDFSEQWLNLKPSIAARKHSAGQLNLPVFRLTDSNKSPLGIRVQDLAEYIDKKAEEAKKQQQKNLI